MSNLNVVTWSLALIPEHAEKIDMINRIILGESYSVSSDTQAETKPAKSEKPSSKKSAKSEKPVETKSAKSEKPADDQISFDEFKKVAQTTKKEHGEEFCMEVLKSAGIKIKDSLPRSVSAVDGDQYEDIISLWQAGPQTSASDDTPEDDGFDDDEDLGDDEPEVDAESVKTALKSAAKSHGRDLVKGIMEKHGIKAITAVDGAKKSVLGKLLKAVVELNEDDDL